MGGPGSNRWLNRRTRPRLSVNDVDRLDVRQVVRSLKLGSRTMLGPITWARRSQWTRSGRRVHEGTLYPSRHLGTPRSAYRLFLVAYEQPRRRGVRYWLACLGCRKVRKSLYLRRGLKLRCRICEGLRYPIENLTLRKRARYRRDCVGRRITKYWDDPKRPPDRPKGMHRERYERLLAEWYRENARTAHS